MRQGERADGRDQGVAQGQIEMTDEQRQAWIDWFDWVKVSDERLKATLMIGKTTQVIDPRVLDEWNKRYD